jgi:hypothetical protein
VRRPNRQAFSSSGREAVTQPGGAQPATAAVEANNGLVPGGGEAIVRIVWSCEIVGRDECESRRGRAGDREGSC